MRRILFAFLLPSLLLGVWAAPVAAADPVPAFVADEVVVQYRSGTTGAEEGRARARVRATSRSTIRAQANDAGRLEVATLPPGSDVRAAIAILRADPAVAFAEPNWIYTTGPVLAVRSPNDPYVDQGWIWGLYGDADKVLDAATYNALKGTYHLGGNIYGSQANEGWAYFQSHGKGVGSKDVHIGVIDTGIDYRHADLDANIWSNPHEVAADGEDNDGNGYVDDVNGWNFAASTNQTFVESDDEDHGTHVAGTIGAEGNNTLGVAGVSWNVSLISAKFFGAGPGGSTLESATKAVDYLTDLKTRHGIKLAAINASWGCNCYSQALYDAIKRADSANILFVAAAGNNSNNNDWRTKYYPASYNLPNVISVAAIDEKGNIASFSNYGARTVHLGAPGVSIGSTGEGDGAYVWMSGTSMAAPHVTGAVALYLAKVFDETGSSASGAAIKSAILENTLLTNSLRRKTITNGRLDISCALGTIVKSSDGTIAAATCAK